MAEWASLFGLFSGAAMLVATLKDAARPIMQKICSAGQAYKKSLDECPVIMCGPDGGPAALNIYLQRQKAAAQKSPSPL